MRQTCATVIRYKAKAVPRVCVRIAWLRRATGREGTEYSAAAAAFCPSRHHHEVLARDRSGHTRDGV